MSCCMYSSTVRRRVSKLGGGGENQGKMLHNKSPAVTKRERVSLQGLRVGRGPGYVPTTYVLYLLYRSIK